MTNSDDPQPDNITRFPDKNERKALEKKHFVHRITPANDEPMINMPPVVKTLCVINIAIFLVHYFLPQVFTDQIFYDLSFVPARYTDGTAFDIPTIISPVTHMFLHASWLHIAMNIGMLMAFGTGLEKKIGGKRMLILYFATGLFGAAAHLLLNLHSDMPMVGASGAISGLFGGIIMAMYRDGMMGQGYKSLIPIVAIWIGISIVFGLLGTPGGDNPIAWATHVGGFIAGLLLLKPIRELKV